MLRPAQDAYGQILLAVLEGRKAHEIMERDDGFVYCGDPSDYLAPFRRWPAVERRAMRFVRGRVLDVGCGAGRVALHVQARGHEVLAIDESPLAVEVARRRGVRHAEVLRLAGVDASLGLFDTILLLRNNTGLAGTERHTGPLLRRLATLTTERGRLVTDTVHPDRLDPAAAGRRIRVRWQHYASPWFRYLMLRPAELATLVTGTGWRILRTIDDGSPRYGIVLEREGRLTGAG
jgi:SAM-dependent methyltransferase